MVSLGGVIGLVIIGLWLWAIYDSVIIPVERVRYLPKAVWVIIVLLFFPIGAAAWFIFGRGRALAGSGVTPPSRATWGGRAASGVPARRTMIAPDDDPDFLRSLNKPKRDDDPSA